MFGGLKRKVRDAIIRRELGKFEEEHMDLKSKLDALVAFLNATPGRKRGIAAIFLGVAAALRALGHLGVAEYVQGFNDVVQNVVVPGMDITGFVFAVIGLAHAKRTGNL